MSKHLSLLAAGLLLPVAAFAQVSPQTGGDLTALSPPTPIPGVICTGALLEIGINPGGSFGVGAGLTGTGFRFPASAGAAAESLAYAFWGDGWKISYKRLRGGVLVDTTAYWQPEVGFPPPPDTEFEPVTDGLDILRDDDQECLIRVRVRTADRRLLLAFEFNFRKAYPSVVVTTKVKNISRIRLFDVVYARVADYDIHQNTFNAWSSNDNAAFACGNNPAGPTPLVVMSIAGYDVDLVRGGSIRRPDARVFYAEEDAWDDYSVRGPGTQVTKNRIPFPFDGNGAVHYKLVDLRPDETKDVVTVYSAAFTDQCPDGVPGPL